MNLHEALFDCAVLRGMTFEEFVSHFEGYSNIMTFMICILTILCIGIWMIFKQIRNARNEKIRCEENKENNIWRGVMNSNLKDNLNLNRKEWDGILNISTEIYEEGICVTLKILKDFAPVDELMMTFTKGTLHKDIIDLSVLNKIMEKWGMDTAHAVEDALEIINEEMHRHFLSPSKNKAH